MRSLREICLATFAAVSLLTMAGCINLYTVDSLSASSSEEAASPQLTHSQDDDSSDVPGGSNSDEAVSGSVGKPLVVGSWTVTVVEAEINPGNNDGFAANKGERLVKIEIELTNNGTRPQRVSSSDWELVDSAGIVYDVLSADEPVLCGERNIPQNKTEDVKVYFTVTDVSLGLVLRFSPSQGESGVLEVPLS